MEQLGIEPKLLLAQVINFTIIVVVLTKFLYEPILTILEKRRREIQEGLEKTEKVRVEEEKLAAKRESVLAQARVEGGKLMEEAKRQAKEKEKEIIIAAQEEAERILERARAERERLKQELLKDVRREVGELASSMAERLLGSVLNTKTHHMILSQHLKQLESLAKQKP